MPPAIEAQWAAWVKSAMVLMSQEPPWPQYARAQADQWGSVERR
jgi:hypothetical protein